MCDENVDAIINRNQSEYLFANCYDIPLIIYKNRASTRARNSNLP